MRSLRFRVAGCVFLALFFLHVVCEDAGPEVHFKIVSCEASYKKTGRGRKTGYILRALVTHDVKGRLFLLRNSTGKVDKWKKARELGAGRFSAKEWTEYRLQNNSDLRDGHYYCLKLVCSQGNECFSVAYLKKGLVFEEHRLDASPKDDGADDKADDETSKDQHNLMRNTILVLIILFISIACITIAIHL